MMSFLSVKKRCEYALFAGIAITLPNIAFASSTSSVYTSLLEKDCEVIKHDHDNESFTQERCAGVANYTLHLLSGDLRETLDVITPQGETFSLDLISSVSGGFSALGNKAEWRVKKIGKQLKPTALIVRFNANDDPENSEKVTSYLVVSKITDHTICVTDVVKPMKNANEHARELADQSMNKRCKLIELTH